MTLISALTAVTTPALADEYEIEQAGASFKITGTQIMNLLAANISLDAARITAGTLAVARGGTNIGSYAVGDLLYASGATTLAKLADVATGNVLLSGGVGVAPSWGKVDVTAAITGIVPSANGGTGVNNAGRTLTISTNSGTLAFGAAASTLTIPATGTAALLAVANVFTATQSIYDSGTALGITLAGAAAGGTVAITATSPAQAASTTAGTPLSITASPAIAGASVAGAAVGGDVTITAGNAARLTSGNANGGHIFLTPGTGIGTGTKGTVIIPENASSVAFNGGIVFGTTASGNAATVWGFNNSIYVNSWGMKLLQINNSSGLTLGTGSSGYGFSAAVSDSAKDLSLGRNAVGIAEINNGTMGQWGALKAGTRDSATNTTSVGLTLGHQSTGTPAASFGIGLKMALNSDTTADQDAAQIEAIWTTATHASRTSAIIFSTVNSAAALAEALRITPTQVVLATSGSGAAASLAFTGMLGTGIYSSSSNRLTFAAGNTGRMEVTIGGTLLASGLTHGFSSGIVGASGIDVALARNGSNTLEVNTGTVGQWAALKAGTRDAGTTTITDGLTLGHQSTGTPAAGFGSAIQINLNSSTTADQNAVRLTAEWVVATHASRTARYKINVYDTASREVLRGEASGTAPMIGFLGSVAQLQQASGANLTNNVTSGGTDDTIANFTDLTVYANDSAAIRNDIYQLARKLKQVNDALRLYGLLT